MASEKANTNTQSVADLAADVAHNTISDAHGKLKETEQQLRAKAEIAGVNVERYADDAKAIATEKLGNVEGYIREQPLQAAGIAFAAGILTALLLRK